MEKIDLKKMRDTFKDKNIEFSGVNLPLFIVFYDLVMREKKGELLVLLNNLLENKIITTNEGKIIFDWIASWEQEATSKKRIEDIYQVHDHGYEDDIILATFSQEVIAEEYMKLFKKYGEIHGYELGTISEPLDLPLDKWFFTIIEIDRDGNILSTEVTMDIFKYGFIDYTKAKNLRWGSNTLNIDEAVKEANNIRLFLIRENIWGDRNKTTMYLNSMG